MTDSAADRDQKPVPHGWAAYGTTALVIVWYAFAMVAWGVILGRHTPDPHLLPAIPWWQAGFLGCIGFYLRLIRARVTMRSQRPISYDLSNSIYVVTIVGWGWHAGLMMLSVMSALLSIYRVAMPRLARRFPHHPVIAWWIRAIDTSLDRLQHLPQEAYAYLQHVLAPLTLFIVVTWTWLIAYAGAPPAWWTRPNAAVFVGMILGVYCLMALLNFASVIALRPFVSWPQYYRTVWHSTIWKDSVIISAYEMFVVLTVWGLVRQWGIWGWSIATVLLYAIATSYTRQQRYLEQQITLNAERFAARNDPLTRLPNRRSLEEYAQSLTSAGLPVIVMILDIDHFKAINDTYGHDVGDQVLRYAADRWSAACRTQRGPWADMVGRWGGEEFVIILPQMHQSAAESRVEAIRCAIQNPMRITLPDQTVTVTVTASAGAIEINHWPWDLTQVVQQADRGLYRAKALGRNQLVWVTDTDPQRPLSPTFSPAHQ